MGPLTLGTQISTKDKEILNWKVIQNSITKLSGMSLSAPVLADLTDKQKRATQTEDARQKNARKILSQVRNLTPFERVLVSFPKYILILSGACIPSSLASKWPSGQKT